MAQNTKATEAAADVEASPGKICCCIDLDNYRLFFRLRLIYGTTMCASILVAVACGTSVEMLYAVVDTSFVTTVRLLLGTLLLVPYSMWLTAILVTRLGALLFDVLGEEPLVLVRAVWSVAFGLPVLHVDNALILLVELMPLGGAVLCSPIFLSKSEDTMPIVRGYVEGNLLAALLIVGLQCVGLVVVSLDSAAEARVQARKKELDKAVFGQHLASRNWLSGSPYLMSLSDLTTGSRILGSPYQMAPPGPQDVASSDRLNFVGLLRPPAGRDLQRIMAYIMGSMLLPLALAFVHTFHDMTHHLSICFVSVCISLLLLSKATQEFVPSMMGRAYPVLVGVFVFVFIAFTLLASSLVESAMLDAAQGGTYARPPPPGFVYRSRLPGKQPYPVCKGRWGQPELADEQQLSVIDLGLLAYVSYFKDEDILSAVEQMTEGTKLDDLVISALEPQWTQGRWAVFESASNKVRVMAFRGTWQNTDAMVDMDLFTTVFMLQLFDKFMSLLEVLPPSMFRRLLAFFSARRFWGIEPIFARALAFARQLQQQCRTDGYELVLTGHSLGGSLAAIVGSRLQIQTVTFSPTGLGYSLDRFGIKDEYDMLRSQVVVQPLRDPVPLVDVQNSFRQLIRCSKKALACHSLLGTLCELHATCGDSRGRELTCAP